MHYSLKKNTEASFVPFVVLNKMLNMNAKIPLPEKTEFQFFKDNTLSNWKFEDCLQFRLGTDKSGSPLGANKIFSQYCQIMNEIKTKLRNEEVKKYVTKVLNINDYKV